MSALIFINLKDLEIPFMRFLAVTLLSCTFLGGSLHAQDCLTQIQTAIGGQISYLPQHTLLTEEFVRQLNLVSSAFHVYPAFFMADDSKSPNSMAFDCGVVAGSTSTVVFGENLTKQHFADYGRINYSIPAIIAHEFTHIVQDERDVHPLGKGTELQADYMAGWYTARVNQNSPDRMSAIRQAISSFYNMGDSAIDPTDTDPHGLKPDREKAVEAGMSIYRLGFEDAWRTSQAYIATLEDSYIDSGLHSRSGGATSTGGSDSSVPIPWPTFIQLAENNNLLSLRSGDINQTTSAWSVSSAPLPFSNKECTLDMVDADSDSDRRFKLSCEREMGSLESAKKWIETRVAMFTSNGATETLRKQHRENTYTVVLRTSHGAEVLLGFNPRYGHEAVKALVSVDITDRQ
jgi:hypothetical protein